MKKTCFWSGPKWLYNIMGGCENWIQKWQSFPNTYACSCNCKINQSNTKLSFYNPFQLVVVSQSLVTGEAVGPYV